MKKNLMLAEIKNYKRKDGTNGAKLIFLDKDDAAFLAYCDSDDAVAYTPEICEDESFNPTRAREYEVTRDVFNGTMSYRVNLNV